MREKVLSYFFAAAVIILIVFPWWLVVDTLLLRLLLVVGVVLLLAFALRLVPRFVGGAETEEDREGEKEIELVNYVREKWKFLLLGFVVYLLLHVYALTMPVLPIDDEHFHVAKGLFFLQAIKLLAEKIDAVQLYPLLAILLLILLGVLVYVLQRYFMQRRIYLSIYIEMVYKTKSGIAMLLAATAVYCAAVSVLFGYFFPALTAAQLGWLVRYGPVGTIINAAISLAGFQELFFVRLLQLVFLFAAGIVFYHVCQFYLSKKTSVFATLSFLLLPAVFYFGNHAFLEPGLVFFTLLSVYFFLLWLQQKEQPNEQQKATDYLLYSFLVLFVGFFYKDTLLFVFFAYATFIVWRIAKQLLQQLKTKQSVKEVFGVIVKQNKAFLYLSMFLLLFALLWIVIRNQFLSYALKGGYGVNVANLFSGEQLLRYARLSPLLLTTGFAIVCSIGVIVLLFRKRSTPEGILLWFIIVLYLVYTIYDWRTAVPRFYLHFLPAVIICGFLFIEWLYAFLLFKENAVKYIVYSIFVVYLLVSSLYLTYHNIDNRFWDYDGLYNYIQQNVKSGEKILFLTHDVYYYFFKYNIQNPIITENAFRKNNITTMQAFYQYVAENNVQYFVLPNPGALYTSIGLYYPDPTKAKFLDDEREILLELNRRIEMINSAKNQQKFVSGNNVLYVVKVEAD